MDDYVAIVNRIAELEEQSAEDLGLLHEEVTELLYLKELNEKVKTTIKVLTME